MIPILVLMSAIVYQVDSVCVSLSTMTQNDTYLQNNLLGVTRPPSLLDCAVSCHSHIECLSFGFEPRKRLCHLHNKDEACAPDDMVSRRSWIHGDLSVLPNDLWGPCSGHNCPVGKKCKTNRVTKKAVCVKADMTPPDGLCPVPPQLDNANISCGGQAEGSTRNYTCLDGYLDTESFGTSSASTCLPDFTWSHPNLTCSGPFVRQYLKTQDEAIFQTVQNETFKYVSGNTSSLVFFSKACSNSIFALCDVPEVSTYNSYLIALGAGRNSRFDIRGPGSITRASSA